MRRARGHPGPYRDLRKAAKKRHDHENTRLLYVAATRARKNLHLLGHTTFDKNNEVKNPEANSLLHKIWSSVEPEFSAGLQEHVKNGNVSHEVKAKALGVPLQRLPADWVKVSPPKKVNWKPRRLFSEDDDKESRPPFDWASDMPRRVGVVVHRMLQQMRAPDRLDFSENTLRSAFRNEGLDGILLDEAMLRATTALNNIVEDDRGRWILSLHETTNGNTRFLLWTTAEFVRSSWTGPS